MFGIGLRPLNRLQPDKPAIAEKGWLTGAIEAHAKLKLAQVAVIDAKLPGWVPCDDEDDVVDGERSKESEATNVRRVKDRAWHIYRLVRLSSQCEILAMGLPKFGDRNVMSFYRYIP